MFVFNFFLVFLSVFSSGTLLVGPEGDPFLFNGVEELVNLTEANRLCQALGGRLPGERDGNKIAFVNNAIPDGVEVWLNKANPSDCGWIIRPKCCGKYLTKRSGQPNTRFMNCNEHASVLCEIQTSMEGLETNVTKQVQDLKDEVMKLSNDTQKRHEKVDSLSTRVNRMMLTFKIGLSKTQEADRANREVVKEIKNMTEELSQDIQEWRASIEGIYDAIGKPFKEFEEPLKEKSKKVEEFKTQNADQEKKESDQLIAFNTIHLTANKRFKKNIKKAVKDLGKLKSLATDRIEQLKKELEDMKHPVKDSKGSKAITKNIEEEKKLEESSNETVSHVVSKVKELDAERQGIIKKLTKAEKQVEDIEKSEKDFVRDMGNKITHHNQLLDELLQKIEEEINQRKITSRSKRTADNSQESLRKLLDALKIKRERHQKEVYSFKITFFPILAIVGVIVVVQFMLLYRRVKADGGTFTFSRMMENDNDL